MFELSRRPAMSSLALSSLVLEVSSVERGLSLPQCWPFRRRDARDLPLRAVAR